MIEHSMPAKSAAQPNKDLELLRSAAVSAGVLALGYFRRDITNWTKGNHSPVSDADIAVDEFLQNALLAARPDYGWLSEETEDGPARLAAKKTYVVDPIDGTRAFLKGEDCWAISIAIVEKGRPVCGVVYAPARDEMYYAATGQGAFFNRSPLLRPVRSDGTPIISAPTAVLNELRDEGVEFRRGPAYPSLAYRLVQVARGACDAAVARRGAEDWDIAAASVILGESGVSFEDVCAGSPVFNKADSRHAALAAVALEQLRTNIHNALRRVYGCPGNPPNQPQG